MAGQGVVAPEGRQRGGALVSLLLGAAAAIVATQLWEAIKRRRKTRRREGRRQPPKLEFVQAASSEVGADEAAEERAAGSEVAQILGRSPPPGREAGGSASRPSSVAIRRITPETLREVLEVQSRGHPPDLHEPPEALESRMSLPGSLALGAFAPTGDDPEGGAGDMLGYVIGHPWAGPSPPPLGEPVSEVPAPAPDHAVLHDLCVVPEAQGMGLGRMLGEEWMSAMAEAGLDAPRLVAVAGKEGFWRRMGFVPVADDAAQKAVAEAYGAGAMLMERRSTGRGVAGAGAGTSAAAAAQRAGSAVSAVTEEAAPRPYEELLSAHRERLSAASLSAAYDRLGSDFEETGLDLAFIEDLRPHYGGLREEMEGQSVPLPWPRNYAKLGAKSLAKDAVRLLVAPLAQPSPEAGHAVARLAKLAADFHAAFFPPPSEVFVNPRQKLHVTLFFCSHPSDPRPDPFAPRGGLASLTIPPEARPGATADVVAKEVAALRVMGAESLDPFVLELDRIVLARSGVLLALWRETDAEGQESDVTATIRAQCRHFMPGASTREPSIIHSTLLRVLSPVQVAPVDRERVVEWCRAATEELQGMRIPVTELWYVREELFSCIEGPVSRIRIGDGQR